VSQYQELTVRKRMKQALLSTSNSNSNNGDTNIRDSHTSHASHASKHITSNISSTELTTRKLGNTNNNNMNGKGNNGEDSEDENGGGSRLKEQNYTFDVDDFNIAVPWTPNIYFSVRGAENFHIYLWIAKDLGQGLPLCTCMCDYRLHHTCLYSM
jgi:hypothetical protein